MKRLLSLVAVLVSLLPAAALAQKKSVLEDKKAETFNEIERGFFFGVGGGYWAILSPVANAGGKSYYSGGQAVQVEMGFDLGERLSPALFFLASSNRMGSDYTGLSTKEAPASGDFSAIMPGATLQARLLGFDDSQDVKRLWIYARGSVGYVIYSPSALLPKPDVLLSVGPGIEYFTRLRHFSIGVEATFNVLALTGAMGFSVFPTVRYAF